MYNTKDEEQMENLAVKTILIFNPQIDKSMNNSYKNERCRDVEI
jgi:hypothetical protein